MMRHIPYLNIRKQYNKDVNTSQINSEGWGNKGDWERLIKEHICIYSQPMDTVMWQRPGGR